MEEGSSYANVQWQLLDILKKGSNNQNLYTETLTLKLLLLLFYAKIAGLSDCFVITILIRVHKKEESLLTLMLLFWREGKREREWQVCIRCRWDT